MTSPLCIPTIPLQPILLDLVTALGYCTSRDSSCTAALCPLWLLDCLVIFLALLFQKCQCSWTKWDLHVSPALQRECSGWDVLSEWPFPGWAVKRGDGSYLINLTYSMRPPHSVFILCPLPLPHGPGCTDSFSALQRLKLQLPIKCYNDIFPLFSWAVITLVYDFKDSGRDNLHPFFFFF